jgi:hypothetical protein
MGTVRLDRQIRLWRAVAFPFFDRVEIAFSGAILFLEIVAIGLLGIKSGWAILLGSYVGMVVVAWGVLPSRANLERREIASVHHVLIELKMREVLPGRFVPPLPIFLRWPRNAIVLDNGPNPSLSGPRARLVAIKEMMPSFDGQ